jgi:hypothetical protein
MPRGSLSIIIKLHPDKKAILNGTNSDTWPPFVLEARQSRSAHDASEDLAEIAPNWPRLQKDISGFGAQTKHRGDRL